MGVNEVLMSGAPSGLKHADGVATLIARIGPQGDRMVSQLHGKLYEQAQRQQLFFAASQAATAVSVALTTTYTGLCLSNPAGNTKKLAVRQVGIGLSLAPAAIATMGLGGGYAAAGVVTHTTPLTTYSTDIGNGAASTGLADAACTIVGTPLVIMPLIGGFTAATLYSHFGLYDIEGAIVLNPGAYCFIYALTAVTGFFSMTWEEMPV